MLKTIRNLSVVFSVLGLSGCFFDGVNHQDENTTYQSYQTLPNNMLYPDSYEAISDRGNRPVSSGAVVVPQTYHLSMGNPEASKNVDKTWVSSQNAQAYTIELATDSKASKVASTLYKAPKQERSAEVKTTQGTYTGVYGTYPSYEAAQAKLNNLPEDIKQDAKITTWGQVQSHLGE